MNIYLSEEFFKIILYTLLSIEIFLLIFEMSFEALWTYLTICWNVSEIKITDYTPDCVIG